MQLKVKTVIALCIFLLISPTFLFGQEFNQKESVEYALKHNPNIIIARNKIEKAEVILSDSRKFLDLDISIQFGYSPFTENRGMGFSVSQNLDRLLGGNKKEERLAQLDLNSAENEFFLVQQQVIKELIEAFGNLESAKRFIKLKEESFSDSRKSLDLSKEKFDLGVISLDEYLAKQREMRQAEFEFQQADKTLKEATLRFYQVIGYKED